MSCLAGTQTSEQLTHNIYCDIYIKQVLKSYSSLQVARQQGQVVFGTKMEMCKQKNQCSEL